MSKKFIYDIGYNSYEESFHVQMYFDKKLSDEELEKYIQEAVIVVLTKALNNEYKYIHWGLEERGITFQDLFSYLIHELKVIGFEIVKYNANFNCFGWASIVSDTEIDWSMETRDTEIDRLRKAIPNELKMGAMEKARLREEEYENNVNK